MSHTPYVAIICTVERLELRDDAQTTFFNVNLSTAVVADGAADAGAFVRDNRELLEMWRQPLDMAGTTIRFDVFAVNQGSSPSVAYLGPVGAATAPIPDWLSVAAPCRMTLSKELDYLIDQGDLSTLLWNPAAPSPSPAASPATSPKASVYQHTAWYNTVAHASTWPKPIPQGLYLSFEVAIPKNKLQPGESVLIFPRFAGGEGVSQVNSVLPESDPWNSYGGPYQSHTSPPLPRWAYQVPCLVVPKAANGLVNMATYWIGKDPAAAVESTSDWRQTLEATIGSRFDYLPRLLGAINNDPGFHQSLSASPSIAPQVWDLGIQMLRDLSDIGARIALEGSSLQDALILRAIENVYGFPAPASAPLPASLVSLLRSRPGDWRNQVTTMLQGVDQTLVTYIKPTSPLAVPPAAAVIPTLLRLYSVLSTDTNLANLLLAWWDSAITSSGSPGSLPGSWPQIKKALSNSIFPAAQLHKRYLSAVAARDVGAITSAAGTPFAGRIGHTAVLIAAKNQMLVFGGDTGNDTLSNDVWAMGTANSSAQPWTQITPSGTLPTRRAEHTAVFDARTSQMFVFGGLANNVYTNELWSLAIPAAGNPSWTKLNPTSGPPVARSGHSAVYDPGPPSPPTHGAMIVFGGDVGYPSRSVPSDDIWVLKNANSGAPSWEPIGPGSPPSLWPPPRMFHSAVYDSTSNRMIVFGGGTGTGLVPNDVWILSNANGNGGPATWTNLSPAGGPTARQKHSAVYDSGSNCMAVFGGLDASNSTLSEVWVLSNANGMGGAPTWTQHSPSGQIPAKAGHTVVYSAGDGSGPSRMIVFSGESSPGQAPLVPDVWALSNLLGLGPAWNRLNPSGRPQLDAAVKASVGRWVHDSAVAASWSGSLLTQLNSLVAADLNDPNTGLDTVADDTPAPTQRPHPVVIQVGGWGSPDGPTADANEDFRRIAGVGLLIRKQGGSPASPWRSLNAADIIVTGPGGSPAIAETVPGKFVPSRLQYRNGMKDPFLTYDNHPLIAKSPAVGLQGQFQGGISALWTANTAYAVGVVVGGPKGHQQKCTTAGTSGPRPPIWNDLGGQTQDGSVTWTDQTKLLSYAPATGEFREIYPLIFGTVHEYAPFAIGHGGAMPIEIERALNSSPPAEIDFHDRNVIRQVPYYRRVPIGHIRVVKPPVNGLPDSGEWTPNQAMQWPQIPPTVYPLARDLGLTGSGATGSPAGNDDKCPLLLLPFSSPNGSGAVSSVSFNVLPPATDINTWERWVMDGSTYGDSLDTANTRKAVRAAFGRTGNDTDNTQNIANNRIGDPAVAALLFQLEEYRVPGRSWAPVDGGSPSMENGGGAITLVTYSPVPNPPDTSANGSDAAWKAVWSAPVPITVQSSPDTNPHFIPANGGFTISVPKGAITRLTVTPLVKSSDFNNRFEPNIFQATPYAGTQYQSVGVNYAALGVQKESAPSFTMLIECPTTAPVDLAALYTSLAIKFDSQRKLTACIGSLLDAKTQFWTVGKFDLFRQDWRWLGRPLPELTPAPMWQAGTAYNVGDIVIDALGHQQICTQAGSSGGTNPPWNDKGGSTPDGSVLWTDQGTPTWEKEAFADRLAGNDYYDTSRRFNLSQGSHEELASYDLSSDARCQYIRFALQAHNRYEGMSGFPSSVSQVTNWKSICVPRADSVAKPPKPLVRLVLPIAQRSAFDLLVITDETWYRFGGLGETLTAQIQPVLGSDIVTIIFEGSPATQHPVTIRHFGEDNGVTYLDSGAPLTNVTNASPSTPLRAGEYSVSPISASPNDPTAQYFFSSADAGVNVVISYRLLDPQGLQHYEYGPDQIVDGSAAQPPLPQIVLEPMGATLDDATIVAPSFSNTYFKGTVEEDSFSSPPNPSNRTSWNQFKVQFRRELQADGGSAVSNVTSDLTDAMWVQTIPDSATFKTAAGSTVLCSGIAASWTPPVAPATSNPIMVTPELLPTGPITGASTGPFELWYVVTQNITDAFGNLAEVYVPPDPLKPGPADTGFLLKSGKYNLRIVEVQKTPTFKAPANPGAFDSYLLNPDPSDPGPQDESVRVVRISPAIPFGVG